MNGVKALKNQHVPHYFWRKVRQIAKDPHGLNNLVDLFKAAKKSNYSVEVGDMIAQNSLRLPARYDRIYLVDLVDAGRGEEALRLWRAVRSDSDYWKRTGIILYAKLSRRPEFEALVSQVRPSTDFGGAVARYYALQQDHEQLMQWIKHTNESDLRSIINLLSRSGDTSLLAKVLKQVPRSGPLVTEALMKTQSIEPATLAKLLSEYPSLLDNAYAVHKALGKPSPVKEELLRGLLAQGRLADALKFDSLNLEMIRQLFYYGVKNRNWSLVDQMFEEAQNPAYNGSQKQLQITLRYYFIKKDWSVLFECFDEVISSKRANSSTYRLIFSILAVSMKHHGEFTPKLKQLIANYIQSAAFDPASVCIPLKCVATSGDLPLLLKFLIFIRDTCGAKFDNKIYQSICGPLKVDPKLIAGQDPARIVSTIKELT